MDKKPSGPKPAAKPGKEAQPAAAPPNLEATQPFEGDTNPPVSAAAESEATAFFLEEDEAPTAETTALFTEHDAQPAADAADVDATEPPPKEKPRAQPRPASAPSVSTGSKRKVNTLGDFRLVQLLGEGGMGTVYKALQIGLDRPVALKVLAKNLTNNKDFVARFQREAKLMAKIDHPNVLRCYAFGEYKGMQYFAMEYVDGGSLEDWMKKLGRLSVGDAVHVILACAHALGHAHEMDLIHRDVKPDNILLTSKGVVKVADLGLAKATSEDMGLTKTGTGAGTPLYMSPEQCRDVKHVDARTDIYALGCMLYYFLTGEVPFKGETVVELYEAKAKGKFPPSRQFNDEVPARLDLIIDKTVAQKLELRYQTCAEFCADLEKLGLANAYLSFLQPEGSEAPPKLGVAPSAPHLPKTVMVPKKPGVSGPRPPARSGTAPKPPAGPPPAADAWFISYRNSDDKTIKRKMTTAQVLQLIREDYFDPKTQASRSDEGPYRLLATYGEFESALRGKITKIKADRKSVKFQAMYAQLEKEQVRRERYRWFRNLFRSFASTVGLLIWLAALAGLAFVMYLLFKYFLKDMIGGWMEKMTR